MLFAVRCSWLTSKATRALLSSIPALWWVRAAQRVSSLHPSRLAPRKERVIPQSPSGCARISKCRRMAACLATGLFELDATPLYWRYPSSMLMFLILFGLQAGLLMVDSPGLNDQSTLSERVMRYLEVA